MTERVFYCLTRPRSGENAGDTEFTSTDPVHLGRASTCPTCGACTSLLPWHPPHRASIEAWSAHWGDIAFGPGSELLVSERFKTLYEEVGLRGLEGFDLVEIVRVKRRRKESPRGQPPPYYCVRAVQSHTVIDQKASEFVWERPPTCRTCRSGQVLKRWSRIIFDNATWQGEDIFIPRGLNARFTSQRFKELSEMHRISGAILVPAEAYADDFYVGESTDRAREILERPTGATVLEKIKENGEIWRYCPQTNELAVKYVDGQVAYDRPFDGGSFWDAV